MENIKLVIWDLDETLWNGTLSEGNIDTPKIELVKFLADHGVVNSISSKNNFEDAKRKLQEFGIWELFVFPTINWNPKGEAVRSIIEDCQLRAVNTVFIDDNYSNINEVKFYNPGIITYVSVEEFEKELDITNYKLDLDHKRLKQYKLLEEKKYFRESYCSSNHEFLIQSDIRIQFIEELDTIKDRLIEMIGRTNQLNYTKKRIRKEELEELIDNPDIENVAIQVVDKFGDYGICGFYSLDKRHNELIHFLFSCRIMNLGVENYIYQKIKCPSLTIIEPVSTKLTKEKVTWIKETSSIDNVILQPSNNKIKLLLLGGCDLEQLCHYFDPNSYELIKDFNYNNSKNIDVHREHTLFQKMVGNISEEDFDILKNFPFLDDNFLDYNYRKVDFDYIVFSPLMNYTQEIYSYGEHKIPFAYGGYMNILDIEELRGFEKEEFAIFKNKIICHGQQSPTEFIEDLEWFLTTVSKPVIFLNGAEVDIDNPNEIGAKQRHILMNAALTQFVERHKDRCKIVDVRQLVKNRCDLKDNIRHYQRDTYVKLAHRIAEITGGYACNPSIIQRIKDRLRTSRFFVWVYLHLLKGMAYVVKK